MDIRVSSPRGQESRSRSQKGLRGGHRYQVGMTYVLVRQVVQYDRSFTEHMYINANI